MQGFLPKGGIEMSSIGAVGAVSSWSTSKTTAVQSSASDEFSQMVANLQKGAQATGNGSSDSSEDSEEITTLTRVMSDGSVLITVMQGDEIISQTKTKAAKSDENASLLDATADVSQGSGHHAGAANSAGTANAQMQQKMDEFNDSSASIMSGSLIDAVS